MPVSRGQHTVTEAHAGGLMHTLAWGYGLERGLWCSRHFPALVHACTVLMGVVS